jgi:predicted porin
MNKKLIALALSAIAAGTVSAQTANVTLYGIIDAYVASERRTGTSVSVLQSGGISGSRWGMRGTESLGGGMNAVFVLENGFSVDTGGLGQGGLLFGRQAYVGLNGGFGSVTVGRQYAPAFYVQCNADDSFGGCLTAWSAVANMNGFFANTLRPNNAIIYATPNMGGVTGALMWSLGEVAGSTSASRTFGANVQYKNGPLYVGVGYSDLKNAAATGSSKHVSLGASYNFGVAYVGLFYAENKDVAGNKSKPLVGSVTVPFGAARIGVQLAQVKSGSAKATSAGLLGEYDLSKRTELYAIYSQCKDKGIRCTADGNTAAITTAANGNTSSAFGLGVKHKF